MDAGAQDSGSDCHTGSARMSMSKERMVGQYLLQSEMLQKENSYNTIF